MRVVALVSGGKDSWYAVHAVQNQGWTVAGLVTVRARPQSMMFQHHASNLVHRQAEMVGIPHQYVDARGRDDLAGLAKLLHGVRCDGLVTGAVASDYQRTRLDRLGQQTGQRIWSPLWHQDHARLLEAMVQAGFDIRIVHTAAQGLDSSWLGRRMDDRLISDLREAQSLHGVLPGGEGGEYETFVLNGPMFGCGLRAIDAAVERTRDTSTWKIKGLVSS